MLCESTNGGVRELHMRSSIPKPLRRYGHSEYRNVVEVEQAKVGERFKKSVVPILRVTGRIYSRSQI